MTANLPTYVLLFGPPGSGKSTQGALLSEHLGVPHFSVGDLLRAKAESDSPEAGAIAEKMKTGAMVEDATVYELLKEPLSTHTGGFILDGFPRTQEQLPMLERLDGELGLGDYLSLDISVPAEVTRTRLLSRGRADDTPEVINTRLERYEEMAAPILSYFTERKTLKIIDGRGDIEEVAQRVQALFPRS